MMSTKSQTTSAYRSHAAKRLARYLRTEAECADGEVYVNGDRLAEELDLPAKKIDRLLEELSGSTPGLSFSIGKSIHPTLWQVSRPQA